MLTVNSLSLNSNLLFPSVDCIGINKNVEKANDTRSWPDEPRNVQTCSLEINHSVTPFR